MMKDLQVFLKRYSSCSHFHARRSLIRWKSILRIPFDNSQVYVPAEQTYGREHSIFKRSDGECGNSGGVRDSNYLNFIKPSTSEK